MPDDAQDLARRLARQAQSACRFYLSNGHRAGRYWLVGDVYNTPGRSLFVRLTGPDTRQGAAGKWTDAATGEHGDLLDIIRARCGLSAFPDVLDEARRFLSLPPHPAPDRAPPIRSSRAAAAAARRLFACSSPIAGSLAETYLQHRGLAAPQLGRPLRFHPHCYYRRDGCGPSEAWPAMIAAVTDLDGRITGVHRTWLAPSGRGKAPVATPRRALGALLGHAVRIGAADDVLAAGEGIETVLSVRRALPALPAAAALSAGHLAALAFPPALRRLYIIRDRDPAGERAATTLTDRCQALGIEAISLSPRRGDFNEDLLRFGANGVLAALCESLLLSDLTRFMPLAA